MLGTYEPINWEKSLSDEALEGLSENIDHTSKERKAEI